MSRIKNIDLINNTAIAGRDVTVSTINSIDINQSNGTYSVVEPYDADGGYDGKVVIYPQSPVSQSSVELKTFNIYGSLYYPCDAKFDYVNNKIWIADAGNNRVLKVNLNTNLVDLDIDSLIYPHSLAVDFNTGNIFIKAYESYNLNHGAVFYYKKDGTLISTFLFNRDDTEGSSSSSSSLSSSSSSSINVSTISIDISSSSSSSSGDIFPTMPYYHSIVFDHVRYRAWWVDGIRIYACDIRNKQVQTYDIRSLYTGAISVNVEFSTGNAFVVVEDIHEDRFIIEMSYDNKVILGTAYIGG